MYVSKDARIRGHFSKSKWVRERKTLGNTGVKDCIKEKFCMLNILGRRRIAC